MKEGVSGQVVANEKFSAAATIAAHHLHCDRDYDSSLVLRLDVNVYVFSHHYRHSPCRSPFTCLLVNRNPKHSMQRSWWLVSRRQKRRKSKEKKVQMMSAQCKKKKKGEESTRARFSPFSPTSCIVFLCRDE